MIYPHLDTLVPLMIEALIDEAVRPIAATGRFANVQGLHFLLMVERKVNWLKNDALAVLSKSLEQT